MNVLWWSQGDSLPSPSSGSVRSEAIPAGNDDDDVGYAAPLRTHLDSLTLSLSLVVGSSLAFVAPPPTPTRDASAEVNAWPAWFATNKLGAFADELGPFRVAGDTLLSYTKDECWQLSPRWGIALYNSLRKGTSLSIYRYLWSNCLLTEPLDGL